jgi:hypothetical protein
MAVKTFYVLNTAATSPGWFGALQDGGTAPTAANATFGFAPGKLAVSAYCRARLGASGTSATTNPATTSFIGTATGPTAGTGATNTTSGDSFITPAAYTGAFPSGNWTFTFNMIATTAGLTGRLGIRVWASVNTDGSSARELTSGEIFAPTAVAGIAITTSATALTATWAAPAITLNNEYLFFQLEYQESSTTSGSVTADNALFRVGSSIVTTNLAALGSASFAGGGALTANAIQVTPTLGTPTGPSGSAVWYKFEDTVTTDSSGNSNTGILAGTTLPTLVAGKFGNALSFTGTFGSGAHVNFTSVASLGLPTVSSEITIACWINTTQGDGCILVSLRNSSGNGIINLSLGTNAVNNAGTGTPSILIRDDAGAGLTTISASTACNDGSWHHVAFTRNSSQLMTFYVDGVASGTPVTDTMTTSVTPSLANSGVGIEVFQPWTFIGLIDDFRIYPRALTSTEVASLTVGVPAATTWQGTATPAGTGALTVNANLLAQTSAALAGASALAAPRLAQWLVSNTSFAGAGTLAAGAQRYSPLVTPIWSAVGALSVDLTRQVAATLWQSTAALSGAGALAPPALAQQLVGAARFTGAGQASWPTVDPIDQLLATRSTLTGASSQTSALNVLLNTASALTGAGTASWPFTDPIDQLMAASSALVGSGALVGDVTRLAGAGTLWQGTALWVGASTLAAQASVGLAATAALAGVAALSVAAPSLQLASSATLAGAGTSASSLLTLRPVTASLAGVASLVAATSQLIADNAAFAGSAALTASAVLRQPGVAAFAGSSTLAATSLPQWLAGATNLLGVGALQANLPVQRGASAALSGAGNLAVGLQQWLPTSALFSANGQLSLAEAQWQVVAAQIVGAGNLGAELRILGAVNQWSGNALLPGAGALSVTESMRLASAANLAGASQLTGGLQARLPTSILLAGAGQLLAALPQLIGSTASFTAAGALSSHENMWLQVATAFSGTSSFNVDLVKLAVNILQGSAALFGTGNLTTALQAQLPASAAMAGTSALTAQAAQRLPIPATLFGAGALTAPLMTLSGSLAGALAGVGNLGADVQRFTPGIWSANAALIGASSLTANYWQLAAISGSLSAAGTLAASSSQWMTAAASLPGLGGFAADISKFTPGISQASALFASLGNLTAATSQRMAAGSLWAGASVLTADLGRLGQAAQISAAFASVGGFSVVASLALPLSASFGAAGTLIAVARQMAALAPQPLRGASAINAYATNLMALQTLFGGAGILQTETTAFQQVAAALAGDARFAGILTQRTLLGATAFHGAGRLFVNFATRSVRLVSCAPVLGQLQLVPAMSGHSATGVLLVGERGQGPDMGGLSEVALLGQTGQAGAIGVRTPFQKLGT